MTEAIIITAIIVAGIVAAFGLALHFGFKAWQTERILQHDAEDNSVNVAPGDIHISAHVASEDAAIATAQRHLRQYPFASN